MPEEKDKEEKIELPAEYKEIHSKSFKDIIKSGQEDPGKKEDDDEAKKKKEAEDKAKKEAEDKAKADELEKKRKEEEQKREDEIAERAAKKAKEEMAAEIKKVEEDKKLSEKQKEEEKARIKFNWTGKDPKTGAVTPADYDEIGKEAVRIAKEEMQRDFDRLYEERRAKEKAEEEAKSKDEQAKVQNQAKEEEDRAKAAETRINAELDLLSERGDLPRPKDPKDKTAEDTKAWDDFINQALTYNKEHPDAQVSSPITFYHYYYKKPETTQPAGADAPIGGGKTTTVNKTDPDKYNYATDHNKSFRQLRREEIERARRAKR